MSAERLTVAVALGQDYFTEAGLARMTGLSERFADVALKELRGGLALVVHLACPASRFLDTAKVRLDVPAEIKQALGVALWKACRGLYREAEQRRKDAALYYAVRPRLQELTRRELDFSYFSQQYQSAYGPIPGLYYEPRGALHEPHGGRVVELGTREVEGYNIARTLAEETARMPGYAVEVVDIGLRLQEALDLGLETETFTRKKALLTGLELTDAERRMFEGRRDGKSWIAERVELNAFTRPDLIAFVERKLGEARATGKVIPPAGVLEEAAAARLRQQARTLVEEELDRLLDLDAIAEAVTRAGGTGSRRGPKRPWRGRRGASESWSGMGSPMPSSEREDRAATPTACCRDSAAMLQYA